MKMENLQDKSQRKLYRHSGQQFEVLHVFF